jgi:hypothetical protein
MTKKVDLTNLFEKAIDPYKEGDYLRELEDCIATQYWAVKKDLLDSKFVYYEKYLKEKMIDWNLQKIIQLILEQNPQVYICNNLCYARRRTYINDKIKFVYITDIKEVFTKITLLKEIADFLKILCKGYELKLYVVEDFGIERADFVWFDKENPIAICSGVIELKYYNM